LLCASECGGKPADTATVQSVASIAHKVFFTRPSSSPVFSELTNSLAASYHPDFIQVKENGALLQHAQSIRLTHSLRPPYDPRRFRFIFIERWVLTPNQAVRRVR
jgi:hypothetical protein